MDERTCTFNTLLAANDFIWNMAKSSQIIHSRIDAKRVPVTTLPKGEKAKFKEDKFVTRYVVYWRTK